MFLSKLSRLIFFLSRHSFPLSIYRLENLPPLPYLPPLHSGRAEGEERHHGRGRGHGSCAPAPILPHPVALDLVEAQVNFPFLYMVSESAQCAVRM